MTNNPVIANAYAEMVFALLLDLHRMGRFPDGSGQPLHICELGAGTGKLAFHILRRLGTLCEQAGFGARAVRYVLTDVPDANLEFWRSHAQLKTFFAAGTLDFARFDAATDSEIRLELAGTQLAPGALELPLVTIANYVFDGLPQDLLYFDAGQASQCVVSVHAPPGSEALSPAQQLALAGLDVERQPLGAQEYDEPWLNRMVNGYRCALRDTHLLVPVAGLRCVERLRAISASGLLLLTADKGTHHLANLEGRALPQLVRHGSFSFDVNYHAFQAYCEMEGGLAMFPDSLPRALDVGACLFVDQAAQFQETRRAFERHFVVFGPDHFCTLARHLDAAAASMDLQEIVACLNLSRHDPHHCLRCLPRLAELAPSCDRRQQRELVQALDEVWQCYYALGERFDLADLIARVCYSMADYERALAYFTRSARLHGDETPTTLNIAACHHMLGHRVTARRLARRVLEREPGHACAAQLLGQPGKRMAEADPRAVQ